MTMQNHTQEHGENISQNNQLMEREKIEGTPFTLVKQDEKYFITMGDHRLTEPTLLRNAQYKKLEEEKWLILTNVIIIILEKMNQNAQIIKQTDNYSWQKEEQEVNQLHQKSKTKQ